MHLSAAVNTPSDLSPGTNPVLLAREWGIFFSQVIPGIGGRANGNNYSRKESWVRKVRFSLWGGLGPQRGGSSVKVSTKRGGPYLFVSYSRGGGGGVTHLFQKIVVENAR